jgi:hypothetical protein
MNERRLHTRFAVEDMDVHTSTVVSTDVEIHDMSPTGVSIICSRSLSIGKEYALKFDVDGGPAVPVRAVVRWEMPMGCRRISPTESVPLYLAGMEFRDVLTDKVAHIIDFLKEIADVRDKRPKTGRFRIRTQEKAVLDYAETYSVKLISLGGMLIKTKHEMSVQNVFHMELFLPDDDAPIRFRGKNRLMPGGAVRRRYTVQNGNRVCRDEAGG